MTVLRTKVARGEEWMMGNGMFINVWFVWMRKRLVSELGRLDIIQIVYSDIGFRKLLVEKGFA